MADLKLGRTMQSNNGSQDSLLRSVKQKIDQTKFKGKVNDDAINAILQAIATQQENQGQYQLELASKNNDAIVNKIKDAIEKLYEAQQSEGSSEKDNSEDNSAKDTSEEVLKKIQELKDEFSQTEDNTETAEQKTTSKDYSGISIPDSFQKCQDYIASQLETIEKNIHNSIGKFSFKLPKISIPGLSTLTAKLKSFKLPKFKLLKFKLPKFKLPDANMFKGISEKISSLNGKITGFGENIKEKFSSFGKSLKTIGSGIKNVALAPFKAIGKAFSFLNPFKSSNDKFSFDKLTKFLKKFFAVKNVNKWLDNFLKKHVKTLQKHVSIIIKPIKKLIVFAIEKIASVISGLFWKMFITFFPIIAVIWGIFALIILAGYLLYKAYKWVKDVAIPWISKFAVKIWNGIKYVGKVLWKAIKYIFWDMWIDLGKWVWKKLVEFGNWLKEKAIDPIVNFIKTYIIQPAKNIYDKWIQPLVDSFNNLVSRIKTIWNNFKWNESKSFLENLQQFWINIKTSIKDWWSSSKFKEYYDKLVGWLSDMLKPLKEWWDQSWFKQKFEAAWTSVQQTYEDIKRLGFGTWLKNKISVVWESMLNFGKRLKEWWDQSSLKKTVDSIWNFVKSIPKKIISAVKSILGLAGKAVGAAVDGAKWLANKTANMFGFGKKDEVKDPMQNAVDELNKERERTIKIDVGAVKDILDLVTEISKLLATTIATELHAVYEQLIPQNNAIVNDQPTIESSYQTIKSIHDSTNQSETIEDIANEANTQENDKEAKTNTKFSNIENFLKAMSLNMNENFQKIIDKLDDKPNLIPIPLMENSGNAAMMENMI